MSGISGYGSPINKRLKTHNQQADEQSQSNRPANTEIVKKSNENSPGTNSEVNPPVVIKSKTSDTKNNPYKVDENISETSYISTLSASTSQFYEPLYSSEDDSLPKIIDERDEKRKSFIVIRDSTTDIQLEESKCDIKTKLKLKSKTLLDKADNEIKDDVSEVTAQKQLNPLLKTNEPKQTDIKENENLKLKDAVQTPSEKLLIEQTAQLSQVNNNDKEANPPTTSTAKSNETKKTESFTTQYLLSAEKLDETKLKKLAQIQKKDNLDQRSKNANEFTRVLKTDENTNEASNVPTLRDSTTNVEDLQPGENCLETLSTDTNNETLDILDNLHNTDEGTTYYDVGDNLLEKPNVPISIAETRKMLSTESQIENLRRIRCILEDKLKHANNPEEEDEEYYHDAVSDPQPNKLRIHNAGKSTSDESEHTKLLEMLTDKSSKIDKLKSVKSSVTVVEVVKFIPDALIQAMPSAAFKLTETQAPNNQCLKQLTSNEARITARSEDASEIIQVISPDENQRAAFIGELVKVEPKDSCEPCPGIKPSRTSCLDPPEKPVETTEEQPPYKPPRPPFECFEPEDTPEYEDSDTGPSETPPSKIRMLWWKIKQSVLSVVLGMYNCFHCDRFCPILSPAKLQSPNTSAAYESTKPVKTPNEQIKINSNSSLIHSRDSVLVHTKDRGVNPKEAEKKMIKPERVEPEKSRSTVTPEKIKSMRFDLVSVKVADSDEIRQMPVKSTVPRKF